MSDHQDQTSKGSNTVKYLKFQREWKTGMYFPRSAITSAPFIVQDYGNAEWHMEMTFSRIGSNGEKLKGGCYSLGLSLNEEPGEFFLNLTFTLLFPQCSIASDPFSKSYTGSLKQHNIFQCFVMDHSLRRLINPAELITIVCEVELKTLSSANEFKFDLPNCDLSHDFGALYNDETTADVTLTVGDKMFHAHKLILSARSSVFAAMFRNEMKETITKNVDIEDLDAYVLDEILRFIYTDEITDLESDAIELLDAADKYDLQNLKVMCEKTLYQNVNVESAAEILVLADRHRAQQLKAQVFRFIKSHMKEIIETEGYKNLEKHHAGLIVEAFNALAILEN